MALSVFWGRPSGILMACNEEQRQRYLIPSARGERFDALAMTEPPPAPTCAACSAPRALTAATGSSTAASTSSRMRILPTSSSSSWPAARKRRPAGRKKESPASWSTGGTPGFEIRPGYDSVSHRGTGTASRLRRLPAAGRPGSRRGTPGFDLANEWLYGTRLTVAAMCVGRARRAFDLALAHAAERRSSASPSARFQGVSFKLADMITGIDAADWLTLAPPGASMRAACRPGNRLRQAVRHRNTCPG